ncbi:MAG: hypothetical protein R2932_17675 [Caldilineaceae bacterium]
MNNRQVDNRQGYSLGIGCHRARWRDLWQREWVWYLLLLCVIIVGGGLLIDQYERQSEIIRDRKQLQAFVDQLGWMGPLALIFFNALQIVVAPVPGYVVQLAAGFLYGPWWGGLWSTLGLAAGSMTAMWLAYLWASIGGTCHWGKTA